MSTPAPTGPPPSHLNSASAKAEIRRQWNIDSCGAERGAGAEPGSLEWFERIEQDRYGAYAPWIPKTVGFERYRGKQVLEVGGGLGTDLSRFARGGASVVDCDFAEGHLRLAKRNFEVRGLTGDFLIGDGETLPFADASFDLVYSFGVIHHTPGTQRAVSEFHRVLRPGGEAIVMVYAKHSWNYWYRDVYCLGWHQGLLKSMTIEEILSAHTEYSPNGARPLVKVYTASECREMFSGFRNVRVIKRQLTREEIPWPWSKVAPIGLLGRVLGWNLVVFAVK